MINFMGLESKTVSFEKFRSNLGQAASEVWSNILSLLDIIKLNLKVFSKFQVK